MCKLLSVLLALSLTILLIGLLPVHGEEQIYNDVIRLHVIANSDSDRDQSLKLLVRDALLARTEELISSCKEKSDAETIIRENLSILRDTAEETLRSEGCSDSVQILFDKESYPTRHYRSISLPAGDYLSLRVVIGSGNGQNWWCVLYPSLCLSAASESGEIADLGFRGEQYRIITNTRSGAYEVRFKLLELLSEWS